MATPTHSSSSEEQMGSQDGQLSPAMEDGPLAEIGSALEAEPVDMALSTDAATSVNSLTSTEAVSVDTSTSTEAVSVDTSTSTEALSTEATSSTESATLADAISSTEAATPAEGATFAEKVESLAEKFYQVPTRNVTWIYRILFGIAAIVLGVDNVTIKQLVLPAQMALLDPIGKVGSFALISAVGGIAGVIGSPLIGAISDRTTWGWGRRRSWMIITTVGVVIGLVIMGAANSIWQVLLGEILVQFWVDGLLAVCTAIIPDQIPPAQRASTAAFVGMSPLIGGAVGIILISRLTNVLVHPDQAYYTLAITSAIFVILFLLVFREKPLPRELVKNSSTSFSESLADFWVNPITHPDFGFVWLSRCLAFFGYQVLITFLLYYLQDVIKMPHADQGVATFTAVTSLALLVAAITSGIIADRVQRFKPFVVFGALLMGVALLVISFATTWPVFIIASIFVGIGWGAYLAVDQAIAVRVLPRLSARGKDLGLIKTAIFIPLIIGPLLGDVILSVFPGNYTLLYAVTAVLLMLAAVFILPVKSVR